MENNPYLSPLDDADPCAERIASEYPIVHSSLVPYHFVHGFRLFLNRALGLQIRPHAFRGTVHVRDEERQWLSQ
ncbi:MAG: hypothetical protein WKH64_17645 [Chloroflexia bacterium]